MKSRFRKKRRSRVRRVESFRSNLRNASGRKLVFEPLEERQLLAVVTWDGGGDGVSWGDALNWSGDAQPGLADDVLINAGGNVTITHATGTDSIKSLTTSNSLVLSGGVLDIQTTASISAPLILQGGTLKNGTLTESGGAQLVATSLGG